MVQPLTLESPPDQQPLEQEWAKITAKLRDGTVVTVDYGMWPKQKLFHQSRKKYVVFGGARGPGKSRALVMDIYRDMLEWPGIPILLCRRDLADLKKTTEVEWQRICPPQLYDPKYGGQYHKGERWYQFPNGSRLMLGELKDWESYKSATLGKICIDEVNEIEEDAMINLAPALRWTTNKGICDYPECANLGPEFAREHPRHPFYQIKMATNPSPGWVKKRFWEPWKEGHERANHQFILATAFDNPSLPPDYIPSLLETNTATWVRNYIYGDWSAFENMVWPMANRAVHSWRGDLPEFVRVTGGIDYGATTEHAHRTAAYLTGETRSGVYITFWEYSKQGAASTDFYSAIAAATKQFNVRQWAADSTQHRANELAREAGIPIVDAPGYKGAVKDTIAIVDRLMKQDITGNPQIYISDDCPRLWGGIEMYQMDPNTGKPLSNQDDDECDAWRYNVNEATQGRVVAANRRLKTKTAGAVESQPSDHIKAWRKRKHERLAEFLRENPDA